MNKIKIKPSHKGRFTEYKKRTGKTTEEALHSKSKKVRAMAQFAKNAKSWKKEDGGEIKPDKEMLKLGGYIPKANNGMYSNNPLNLPDEMQQGYQNPPNNLQPLNLQLPQYQQEQTSSLTPSLSNYNPNVKQNQSDSMYPPTQGNNKQQNSWNNANYNDVFGHDRNYWGDFVGSQFKAVDALSHAIPDTFGTYKSNKFTELNEANNIKRQMNPFQSNVSNFGSNPGQQRALGGNVNDYKADGGNNMMSNVETEGKEMLQMPQGLIGQINGPSHDNGGVPMNLPEGTKVFSERLKHPDEKKSFAKLAKKYDTTDEKEMLDNSNADKIQKDSANFAIQLKNKAADELFQDQEKMKLGGVFGKKIASKTKKDYKNMQPQIQDNQQVDDTPPFNYGGLNRLGFWNGIMPGIETHSSANGGVINGQYEEVHRPDLGGYFRKKRS